MKLLYACLLLPLIDALPRKKIEIRQSTNSPSVTVSNGTVNGLDQPQFSQELFLGIPYAQPPVNSLRLTRPQPLNASFGTLQATEYGPHCWSRNTTGYDDNSGFPNSEDCLTLNVIRPYGVYEGGQTVPVLFWIHGGGDFTGGSADYRYNATSIVQASVNNGHPLIFVSCNYRLASLGFLGGKVLEDEGLLNLGYLDQRLALNWVHENIAKFGGDPTKVTIQGESAGGGAVHAHIQAYGGKDQGLFRAGIIESGGPSGPYSMATDAAYQRTYNSLISNTSCSSTANSSAQAQLACIRALPIDEFRLAGNGSTDTFVDGSFISAKSVFAAYANGNWVKVPILIGSNTDEGQSFTESGANTTEQVRAALSSYADNSTLDGLLSLYPNDPYLGCPFDTGSYQLPSIQNGVFLTPGAQNKRTAAITGDIAMAAGARWVAQTLSKEVTVYKYRFNHIPWSVSFSVEDFVGHFTEVSYVFNLQNNDTAFWVDNHFTATYLGPDAPNDDRYLGIEMSSMWASFAATGDPNNANVTSKPTWPKYSENQQNLVFQTKGSFVESDSYRSAGIDYIVQNIFLKS